MYGHVYKQSTAYGICTLLADTTLYKHSAVLPYANAISRHSCAVCLSLYASGHNYVGVWSHSSTTKGSAKMSSEKKKQKRSTCCSLVSPFSFLVLWTPVFFL